MKLVRKYEEGGKAGDPRSAFMQRAQKMTGRPLAGMENLQGLDYERLQGMTDDEMQGLLDLVNRLKPEDKGDVSKGIGKALDNIGEIKGVVGGLRDNYGLDTEKLLDSILKERDTGYLKSKMIKGAASMAGLYAGGGLMKLRKQRLY
tara:strand:- start:146 stop:586 length:441 start_codon:yes stop_codon:yes gene_type:complete